MATLNPSWVTQGRNKSNLLLLLLYRLPSNSSWPSEQTISTITREEDRAGCSVVSFPVNPAPSSQLPSEQGPAALTGRGNNKRRLVRGWVSSEKQTHPVSVWNYFLTASVCLMPWLPFLTPWQLLPSNFCCCITSIDVVSILADIRIQEKHPFHQAQAPATSWNQVHQGQVKSEDYYRFWTKPLPNLQY